MSEEKLQQELQEELEQDVLKEQELVTEEREEGLSVQQEPTFIRWDYGDLVLECSHCGYKEVVEKGLKDGLQFILPTTDQHKLKLACSECGVSLSMYYEESSEETKQLAEEKYQEWMAEQKAKAEAIKKEAEEKLEETEDALLQEDKAEEPAQGDN